MEHRGMKKWPPFATMPEQYIVLQEAINKQLEVPQPLLTEEQREQINFNLIEALYSNKKANFFIKLAFLLNSFKYYV
ncbi:YolD-like family protein [Priestia aryabhattai]|uniref:YolD-like family protein n=1 Tax=Priestia aryabhattai TaxID=412384 RepID=UPI00209AAEC4|nr:YolD-like family protein [Priestia aryabhattai]